jgi:hypothetical protein
LCPRKRDSEDPVEESRRRRTASVPRVPEPEVVSGVASDVARVVMRNVEASRVGVIEVIGPIFFCGKQQLEMRT